MKRLSSSLVFILAFMVAGCVISPRRTAGGGGGTTGGGGGGTPGTGGQLYVSTPNAILRFSSAETVSGNTAPTATITTVALSSPQHIAIDTVNNRLYVANQGTSSVLIFDNASTLTGAAAPRALIGNATGLSQPVDVAIDTGNDILYVADGIKILVYSSASTINGNQAPSSSFTLGTTIGAIFLDAVNNQLYFTDPADNAVDRVDSPNTQVGIGIVTGSIAGPDTDLSQPRGVFLNSGANSLLVSNSSSPVSVTIYGSANVNTGDVLPTNNINGSATTLQSPQQIAFNPNVSNGELYVADPVAASILIYTSVTTTTGALPPTRTITGSSTGLALNAINGIALDTTR
jgi:hypothetical protein